MVCRLLDPYYAINYNLSLALPMRRLIWRERKGSAGHVLQFLFISFSFDLRWHSRYLFIFHSHSFSSFSSRCWFPFLPFFFPSITCLFFFFICSFILFLFSVYLLLFTYLLFLLNYVDVFLYFIVHDKVIILTFC